MFQEAESGMGWGQDYDQTFWMPLERERVGKVSPVEGPEDWRSSTPASQHASSYGFPLAGGLAGILLVLGCCEIMGCSHGEQRALQYLVAPWKGPCLLLPHKSRIIMGLEGD